MSTGHQDDSDFDDVRTREPSSSSSRYPSKVPPVASKSVKALLPSRNRVYVEAPVLRASQKQQYKPTKETSLNGNAGLLLDEVIGEYEQDDEHYYFARYAGGIARKFPAIPFRNLHKDLVAVYEKKKLSGTLAPFDPSASYIHPLSRITVKIRISSDRRSRASQSMEPEYVPDSEEEVQSTGEDSVEEIESEEDEDEDFDGAHTRVQPRRAARANTRKELPFSPKKSRQVNVLVSSGEESDPESGSNRRSRSVRRSTRNRKTTTIVIDSDADSYIDEDEDDEAEDDDEEDDAYMRKGKQNKANKNKNKRSHRPKSAQPMYGRFRDISTLDEDPFSDEETELLRRHRDICEKCHLGPSHKLLAAYKKRSKKKGKKRKRNTDDEFEESDDEEKYNQMGGWVQCLRCPVSAHWRCLASTQRDEVLRAAKERDKNLWEANQGSADYSSEPPKKRSALGIDQVTEFICGACTRGGICMGCMETALVPDLSRTKIADARPNSRMSDSEDIIMKDETSAVSEPVRSLARELLFRCFTCKRLAHYRHLTLPPSHGGDRDSDIADIAAHYQQTKNWLCSDCSSFGYDLDRIIAWRPYPPNAKEPTLKPGQIPDYKTLLPREYLVKWVGRSYRRLQWVPHMWLVSTNNAKLKNFISGGTKVELLKQPVELQDDEMDVDDSSHGVLFEKIEESRPLSVKPEETSTYDALPDAERRIPTPWKTVDRILDVLLWRPPANKLAPKLKRKKAIAIMSEGEDDNGKDKTDRPPAHIFEKGEQPPSHLTETLDEWENDHDLLKVDDIGSVVWAFIKWDGLGYDEATWDTPPRPGEPGYTAFKKAFERFFHAQTVFVPKQTKSYWETFDNRKKDEYGKRHALDTADDLELGQAPNLKLMSFQVDGFNWLCNNWWNHQHCILADEMGLGKTVQIVTFLGNIAANWSAFPALVVVPNSTITNWVREFERWAPHLRVVPFSGEKSSRDVVKTFELFHKSPPAGNTKTKFHVLVTTYETLTNAKEFTPVFKNQPRWEVLVVDEGQRLKSDASLLFKKLNELNTAHRIIMTGTPLNNNMRELFNLMNFLDPENWRDLEALEKQHEVLDEELVKQLHTRLRPYFLRRIKSEVLQLPPKNEVIVPISMAPLQREVYRSILSHNLNILNGLSQPSNGQSGPGKSRINNVLMQLRKCLQHPYLYAEDIEPRNLAPQETHEKLIDASGKLRFLKALLPKLKDRGHRVLLFSQFVIGLNVIEDFLQGEGYKFLRLDGNTAGSMRQKAMDEYNKPDSEYFIFLLTTRAGGVGINLFTADTVIIYDPDFNPHQDLQAIARAYRYGQTKTCLVFKLMVKDSAEERIMQIGKKKLVLDHLIVQKMDDDDENGGENVQSILTYGAQAIFDSEQEARDITYSEQDIDKLIEKTEKEAVQEAPKAAGGLTFSFAKIWSADKDALEEVVEDEQKDSWAQTLQKLNIEREKQQEREIAQSGRGARRKAADIAKTKMHISAEGSRTVETKQKQASKSIDGSAYSGSEKGSNDSDSDINMVDQDFVLEQGTNLQKGKSRQQTPVDYIPGIRPACGLCGRVHGPNDCPMTERSENLAEFREMLILHADDEPWEDRSYAVQSIDEILHQRGDLHLIAGQPLHPLPRPIVAPPAPKKPKAPGVATISKPAQTQQGQQASSSQTNVQKNAPPVDLMPPPCPLCRRIHSLNDCPVVLEGSASISTCIKILEEKNDPSLAPTLLKLRCLLVNAKARESIPKVK